MNIKEIAKELTREEFEKCLVIGKSNKYIFQQNDKKCVCPIDMGMKISCDEEENNCYECWANAIENIKFKGEE